MSQRGMDWRHKRENSWGLFALAGMLAVVAVLQGQWKGPFWAMSAAAVVTAVGALWLARLQTQAKQAVARTLLSVIGGVSESRGRGWCR